MATAQLECRIVITRGLPGGRTELGMYDPVSGRYERLGTHGPADVDRAVRDLAASIRRAGHRLTWCERTAQ